MNIKNILMAFALSAFIFASCSSDDETVDNWDGAINLSTKAQVMLRANSVDVPDKQIAESQQVGVYITEDGGANPAIAINAALAADGQGGLSGTTYYYPQTGNGVKIKGYHPYSSDASDSYIFAVSANQSVDNNYYASDLLYCTEFSQARTKSPVTMVFDHKLAKIAYTFKKGDGIQDADLAGAVVKVLQLKPETTFDRTTGTISAAAGTATDITLHAIYGAVIVPQSVAHGVNLLEVTLAAGGKLYAKVTEPAGVDFESGKRYDYEITVTLTGISLKTSVNDWTSVGRQVEAEME